MYKKLKKTFIVIAMVTSILTIGCSNKKVVEEKGLEDNIVSILEGAHPIYYGSLERAKEFAKEFENNEVVVSDGNGTKENTFMIVEGYKNKDSVRDVFIDFDKMGGSIDLTRAKNIANEYLPKDILYKYYKKPEYVYLCTNDSTQINYRIIEYSLSENAPRGYDGMITIEMEEINNRIHNMRIDFGHLRCSRLKKHYEKKPWDGYSL